MAGPSVHAEYIDNVGTHFTALIPTWVQTLTGAAAATATAQIPKGYRRRRRMLRNTATGREEKITICDPASASWTAPINAPVTGAVGVQGVTTGFVYGGRIGEDNLQRG